MLKILMIGICSCNYEIEGNSSGDKKKVVCIFRKFKSVEIKFLSLFVWIFFMILTLFQ